MDAENVRVLLISANVGSIFEDPDHMFKPWMKEFTQSISRLDPGFIGIHCQEVGGKNYEASMQHVNHFIKIILGCEEMQSYDRARVFLDEDYTAADKFTALGNLYFIHECIEDVSIWDFIECKFVPVEGREVLSGNIENIPIKEKSKFPQHFFPDFKWSRKGFIRTRWSINNCVFDLINIHLFHDASNIIAMQSSPSVYSENRQQALSHTLQRFENDNYENVPFFIFGDFNFRLDSNSLVKAITEKTESMETRGKKDQVNKITYSEQGNGKVVLTLETKGFDYHEKHSDLFYNTSTWLHQFDKELVPFKEKLREFEFNFPPSYPFSENINDGKSYMKTRCPSWCDRVLFSASAKDIILQEDLEKPCYDILGKDICMGDHKPVYLFLRLKPGKGNSNDSFSGYKWTRKNTLSINGEPMVDPDIQSINIHDYAVFENKHHLPLSFRTSIKSHNSDNLDLVYENGEDSNSLKVGRNTRKRSFQAAAREVCQMERVLLMWPRKHNRHHSSSSEDYNSDSDETNNNKLEASDKVSNLNDNDHQSVDTEFTEITLDDIAENEKNVALDNSEILGNNNSTSKSLSQSHDGNKTKMSAKVTKVINSDSNKNCKLLSYSAKDMHGEGRVKGEHAHSSYPSQEDKECHVTEDNGSRRRRWNIRCCNCAIL